MFSFSQLPILKALMSSLFSLFHYPLLQSQNPNNLPRYMTLASFSPFKFLLTLSCSHIQIPRQHTPSSLVEQSKYSTSWPMSLFQAKQAPVSLQFELSTAILWSIYHCDASHTFLQEYPFLPRISVPFPFFLKASLDNCLIT